MNEPPWAEIDPGIVDAVSALYDAGISTTDSGDGSKAATMGCAVDFPMLVADMGRGALHGKEPIEALTLVNDILTREFRKPQSVEYSLGLDGWAAVLVSWEN